jgi:hypothetical protein
MARLRSHFIVILSALLLLSATAQAQDVKKKEHSPKKAAIMSACLPGLGQIYNGKWWKVPIIYAGFGGLGYLAYSNYTEYKSFLTAYKISTGDLEPGVTPTELEIQLSQAYQPSQLQNYKETFRRDFELNCILLAFWYGLNIVDATVDGHLYSYDVSDDLSLAIDPVFTLPETPNLAFAGGRQTGISLSFNF